LLARVLNLCAVCCVRRPQPLGSGSYGEVSVVQHTEDRKKVGQLWDGPPRRSVLLLLHCPTPPPVPVPLGWYQPPVTVAILNAA